MLRAIVLVGIGGGVGSILRYLTSVIVNKWFHSIFPIATFAVNILGCLAIGLLIGLSDKHLLTNPSLKFLFITGFCGGFTTFSTFTFESFNSFQTGNTGMVFLYIAASVLVGLAAVWLGLIIAK